MGNLTRDSSEQPQVELQKTVLGVILIWPDVLSRVQPLRPEHFLDPKARGVFRAIKILEARGSPVETHSLLEELKSTGDLDRIGGHGYIDELLDSAATSAHLEHHVEMLIESYRKREAHGLLETAAAAVLEPDKSRSEVFGQLQRDIYNLETDAADLRHISRDAWALHEQCETAPHKPCYLGNALLRPNDFGLLVGAAGSGKTFIACHLALCLAMGYPWFGMETKEVRVAFLNLEMDGEDLDLRFTALCEERELWGGNTIPPSIRTTALKNIAVVSRDKLKRRRLHLVKEFPNLLGWIKATGAKVLIIDSLQRLHGGDEFNDVVPMIGAIEQVLDRTPDLAILGLHHEAQAAVGASRSRSRLQHMYASRSRTELTDAARMQLRLVELGPDKETGIEKLALHQGKVTFGPHAALPTYLERRPSGVLVPGNPPRNSSGGGAVNQEKTYQAVVQLGRASRHDVMLVTGIQSKNTQIDHLRALVEQGRLRQIGPTRNPMYEVVTSDPRPTS